jgi:hypothetical protein
MLLIFKEKFDFFGVGGSILFLISLYFSNLISLTNTIEFFRSSLWPPLCGEPRGGRHEDHYIGGSAPRGRSTPTPTPPLTHFVTLNTLFDAKKCDRFRGSFSMFFLIILKICHFFFYHNRHTFTFFHNRLLWSPPHTCLSLDC